MTDASSAPFALHPRLVAATAPLGELPLSTVLLLDDHRFPWVMLVPRRDGIEELFHLEPADRSQLMEEICLVSKALEARFRPFRLNVADIGNLAYQLHIHIVCRFEDDVFWPKTVWSREREPYAPEARTARQRETIEAFADLEGFRPPAIDG